MYSDDIQDLKKNILGSFKENLCIDTDQVNKEHEESSENHKEPDLKNFETEMSVPEPEPVPDEAKYKQKLNRKLLDHFESRSSPKSNPRLK
jgi:hypothetical protein